MLKEPVANDPNKPLISILVYNYYGEHLGRCLENICSQTVLDNIEIIFIDNASTDGSWDTAIEFAKKFQGIITLKRNKRACGHHDNYHHCLRHAKGKYCVKISNDDAFLPEYVKTCINLMEADPFASFDIVRRRSLNHPGHPNIQNKPLVNVLIHNYNYGRYLRQCLESVATQTYDNIEIIFSDNASTDESWDIAVEYAHNYPGKMTIIRNRKNFGPNINLENCYANIVGKYFCVLCSDDAYQPDFIERCVTALEANPDAGYAMVHRTIINEHGSPSDEPPFYNCSCVIPGAEQAAVYMMAAVNPSISQIVYNQTKTFGILPSENILSRWYAQRLLDFNICCDHSMIYIKDPLMIHRIHSSSDSSGISASLVEIFAQYILPHQFAEIAASKDNMTKAIERLPKALEKLGTLCLRYCVNALGIHDEKCAFRYYHLAAAILPDVINDPTYNLIQAYWTADASEKARIVESLHATDNLTTRMVSYDPPSGSVPIMAAG